MIGLALEPSWGELQRVSREGFADTLSSGMSGGDLQEVLGEGPDKEGRGVGECSNYGWSTK